MNTFTTITYLLVFLGSFIIAFKLIKDSNFPKIFKQGKTNSIIVASILLALIVAFLTASLVVKFIEVVLFLIK